MGNEQYYNRLDDLRNKHITICKKSIKWQKVAIIFASIVGSIMFAFFLKNLLKKDIFFSIWFGLLVLMNMNTIRFSRNQIKKSKKEIKYNEEMKFKTEAAIQVIIKPEIN